jgi:hypothetical protein
MDQKDSIEFYVGILLEDDRRFDNFIKYLRSRGIESTIVNHYDDPDGYYTYVIRGTRESYNQFQDFGIVKSLTHYEE